MLYSNENEQNTATHKYSVEGAEPGEKKNKNLFKMQCAWSTKIGKVTRDAQSPVRNPDEASVCRDVVCYICENSLSCNLGSVHFSVCIPTSTQKKK